MRYYYYYYYLLVLPVIFCYELRDIKEEDFRPAGSSNYYGGYGRNEYKAFFKEAPPDEDTEYKFDMSLQTVLSEIHNAKKQLSSDQDLKSPWSSLALVRSAEEYLVGPFLGELPMYPNKDGFVRSEPEVDPIRPDGYSGVAFLSTNRVFKDLSFAITLPRQIFESNDGDNLGNAVITMEEAPQVKDSVTMQKNLVSVVGPWAVQRSKIMRRLSHSFHLTLREEWVVVSVKVTYTSLRDPNSVFVIRDVYGAKVMFGKITPYEIESDNKIEPKEDNDWGGYGHRDNDYSSWGGYGHNRFFLQYSYDRSNKLRPAVEKSPVIKALEPLEMPVFLGLSLKGPDPQSITKIRPAIKRLVDIGRGGALYETGSCDGMIYYGKQATHTVIVIPQSSNSQRHIDLMVQFMLRYPPNTKLVKITPTVIRGKRTKKNIVISLPKVYYLPFVYRCNKDTWTEVYGDISNEEREKKKEGILQNYFA